MILTCPKCQSQYNLNPAQLGAVGRDVRCVSCGHMWFQIPETAVPEAAIPKVAAPPAPAAAAPAAEAPPPAPESKDSKSITDALNSILEQDDVAFEAVLSTVSKEAAKVSDAPLSRTAASSAKAGERKTAVARTEQALPVLTHNPMGMGASAFGGMVFLLCLFLTLMPLFAFREPLVKHYPALSLLYKKMGVDLRAPGEGLKISEVTAEKRIDSHGRMLVVEGKMTNMTEQAIAYPALHVTLKDEHDKVREELDLKPGMTEIASGDVVPLMLQLEDVPDDASSVELRVKEK